MMPSSGALFACRRTNAAASSIRSFSSLVFCATCVTLRTLCRERLREPRFGRFRAQPLDFHHLAARGRPAHQRDLRASHAQQVAHQLHHRVVRAPLHGRRRHGHLPLAARHPREQRRALRAGLHAQPELHYPTRNANSCNELTTNMRRNQIATIAIIGARSRPPTTVGSRRRIGSQTQSETWSRKRTIGLLGSGRTHDSNAFTIRTIPSALSNTSSTVATAPMKFP